MDKHSNEWTHGIGICDMPIAKSKTFNSKTKILERFAWIKSRVVVKKTCKNWKALSTPTPQKKGWSFVINWIKGATLKNSGQWNPRKHWTFQTKIVITQSTMV